MKTYKKDNFDEKLLKKDLEIIETRIRNIYRLFISSQKIYNNGNDSIENILEFVSKNLDLEIKGIISKVNEITSYNKELLLRFKFFLNSLEKIKIQFYEDVERGRFDSLERFNLYFESFSTLLEAFDNTFKEELKN